MDRSSQLKENTMRLLVRVLGLLLISFGVITIVSIGNKFPGASLIDIQMYFILVLIAGAAIVAGYKLVRLHHTGRPWSAMVILIVIPFMIGSIRTSLTAQSSKFTWEIWTFQGELTSANAAAYFDRFDVVPFGVILIGFSLIGFLALDMVKNTFRDQANSS